MQPRTLKRGFVCDEMHFKPYTQPADIVWTQRASQKQRTLMMQCNTTPTSATEAITTLDQRRSRSFTTSNTMPAGIGRRASEPEHQASGGSQHTTCTSTYKAHHLHPTVPTDPPSAPRDMVGVHGDGGPWETSMGGPIQWLGRLLWSLPWCRQGACGVPKTFDRGRPQRGGRSP
jgi:hypothetical protein